MIFPWTKHVLTWMVREKTRFDVKFPWKNMFWREFSVNDIFSWWFFEILSFLKFPYVSWSFFEIPPFFSGLFFWKSLFLENYIIFFIMSFLKFHFFLDYFLLKLNLLFLKFTDVSGFFFNYTFCIENFSDSWGNIYINIPLLDSFGEYISQPINCCGVLSTPYVKKQTYFCGAEKRQQNRTNTRSSAKHDFSAPVQTSFRGFVR